LILHQSVAAGCLTLFFETCGQVKTAPNISDEILTMPIACSP
jgi:hypothetical protein